MAFLAGAYKLQIFFLCNFAPFCNIQYEGGECERGDDRIKYDRDRSEKYDKHDDVKNAYF